MKRLTIYAVLIGLIFMATQCMQDKTDYISAEKIDIRWELITNFNEIPGSFDARFIFENNSDLELKDNWKLFFNIAPRSIIDPPTAQAAVIEHINGDWYQMIPNKDFSLKPQETIEIFYRGTDDPVIKETDAPLGLYFVFYDDAGKELQIVSTDCEILPFTREDQINRNETDEEPIPTAAYRYENNLGMQKIPKDQLLKIIPSPVKVTTLPGSTAVDENWVIFYEAEFENEATYLAEKLKAITGKDFKISATPTDQKQISLRKANIIVDGTKKEAYRLEINTNDISIAGNDAAGVFYGVQSLLALVPLEAYQNMGTPVHFENIVVQDAPRFGFRSLQIDLGRNFQTKETLFRIIDLISFYKLNTFLIYLTEDEGWRLEIPDLPELTEIGAQREHTDSYTDPVLHPAYGSGPFAYGEGSHGSGYISRKEFIELLKYATARHIKVIPSLNFPAHARCAIKPMEARYNRLMAEGKEEEANEYRLIDPDDKSVFKSAQSYKDNVVSVARPSVYRFYKKVMDEIALMYNEAGLELTDIHAGGDEVAEGAWSDSPLAAEIMKENPEYKDSKNLQAYFFKRLLDSLETDNYTIHGWEEVALLKNEQGDYDPNPEFVGKNVIPYVWNTLFGNQDLAYRLANTGYDVVLCPVSNFYFDLAYDKDPKEPGLYWAGFVRTRDAWAFAPFDMFKTTVQTANGNIINTEEEYAGMERLKPEARKRIIGVEAQIWSETIKGRQMIEYYMLPKLFGFAESAWAKERKWETTENKEAREKMMDTQWNIFANTIAQKDLPRLSYLNGGYNYRIPLPGAIIKDGMLYANIEFPGLQMRYTQDGSGPTINSPLYVNPTPVEGNVNIRAFDAAGKSSRVSPVEKFIPGPESTELNMDK